MNLPPLRRSTPVVPAWPGKICWPLKVIEEPYAMAITTVKGCAPEA